MGCRGEGRVNSRDNRADEKKKVAAAIKKNLKGFIDAMAVLREKLIRKHCRPEQLGEFDEERDYAVEVLQKCVLELDGELLEEEIEQWKKAAAETAKKLDYTGTTIFDSEI